MSIQSRDNTASWLSAFLAEDVTQTLIRLPNTQNETAINTVLRRERLWPADAEIPADFSSTPNKPRLQLEGELLYPEFILVRLLENAGWTAGWMNNWKRTFERGIGEPVVIPDHVEQLLSRIGVCTGKKRNGCWDLVAWKGDVIAFIESKQRVKDRIRESQARWLQCALDHGVPESCFAIVEWTSASS